MEKLLDLNFQETNISSSMTNLEDGPMSKADFMTVKDTWLKKNLSMMSMMIKMTVMLLTMILLTTSNKCSFKSNKALSETKKKKAKLKLLSPK